MSEALLFHSGRPSSLKNEFATPNEVTLPKGTPSPDVNKKIEEA